MSKSKRQGTAWETELVSRAVAAGLQARRLAEGGSNDEGDVEIVAADGTRWVVEARARQRLNVTRSLGKALDKSGREETGLAWKRLTGDGARRTPDGVRDGVFIETDRLLALLGGEV